MSTQVTSEQIVNSTVDSSPVGATTPSTGAFTALSASGTSALNGGATTTAPGSTDNSTKVPTTGWVQALFAALGFAISLNTNGYIKLPSLLGGLVMQWGTVSGLNDNTPTTAGFNLTFPNAAYAVFANDNGPNAASGNPRTMGCQISSTSQFTILSSGSGASAFWWAVGH